MSAQPQQPHRHARVVEHKLVVKHWNASTRQPVHMNNTQVEPDQKVESEARMLQWLRGEQADRSLEECAALRRGSLAYEESEVDSNDGHPDLEAEVEVDEYPRTVGQIHHAYRSRARQEESVRNQRASEATRQQRERLKHKYHLVQTKDKIPRKARPTAVASSESAAPVDSKAKIVSESDNDSDTLHLDGTTLLVAGTVYRENVLRGIRRQLSSGRNVLLTVSLSSLADPFENLSEIKFALQQLCSESLLFCVRDQNVLASVNHQRGVVALKLLTRQPSFKNMATLH